MVIAIIRTTHQRRRCMGFVALRRAAKVPACLDLDSNWPKLGGCDGVYLPIRLTFPIMLSFASTFSVLIPFSLLTMFCLVITFSLSGIMGLVACLALLSFSLIISPKRWRFLRLPLVGLLLEWL